MTALAELRRGLSRAWQTMTEGWTELRDRATHAITRFTPTRQQGNLTTAEELAVFNSARWSVLAADVQDKGDEVVVRLEVPGMESEDFDIDVIDDYLVVRGEKRLQREQSEGDYHIRECAYGQFERAIPLPMNVEADKARAKYKRGVLSISLPKQEQARRRRIEVSIK